MTNYMAILTIRGGQRSSQRLSRTLRGPHQSVKTSDEDLQLCEDLLSGSASGARPARCLILEERGRNHASAHHQQSLTSLHFVAGRRECASLRIKAGRGEVM